jgi:hypothetical protein
VRNSEVEQPATDSAKLDDSDTGVVLRISEPAGNRPLVFTRFNACKTPKVYLQHNAPRPSEPHATEYSIGAADDGLANGVEVAPSDGDARGLPTRHGTVRTDPAIVSGVRVADAWSSTSVELESVRYQFPDYRPRPGKTPHTRRERQPIAPPGRYGQAAHPAPSLNQTVLFRRLCR